MAHIETWYRCPICKQAYKNQAKAIQCRDAHPIVIERWAVGKGGKSVQIYDNCSINGRGGVNWALKEADKSDFKEVQKQQLME